MLNTGGREEVVHGMPPQNPDPDQDLESLRSGLLWQGQYITVFQANIYPNIYLHSGNEPDDGDGYSGQPAEEASQGTARGFCPQVH